jgi:hypothetical protein
VSAATHLVFKPDDQNVVANDYAALGKVAVVLLCHSLQESQQQVTTCKQGGMSQQQGCHSSAQLTPAMAQPSKLQQRALLQL